jgi:hypothetical protein
MKLLAGIRFHGLHGRLMNEENKQELKGLAFHPDMVYQVRGRI